MGIGHSGDLGLRRHVMNATARRMPGDKYRFDRPSRSRNERQQELRVIDALTAASMANTVASAVQAEVPWIELISG